MTTQLHAMSPAPGGGADGAPAPNPLISFMPLIIIFVLFYFILIRPQQKQQKEREGMIKAIKEGDKIITVSGLYATVSKVNDDDTLILKISDNTNVKAARSAVDRLQK